MTMSLNEVEALAKKAARGAGYPWGGAEEAAMATRWLCARDIDGCLELAELLVARDGNDYADSAPVLGLSWISRGGWLCPISTGCALSDRAETLNNNVLRIENVRRPILLAPFAATSAQQLKKSLVLSWEGAQIATDGEALRIEGETSVTVATVSIGFQQVFEVPSVQSHSKRAQPDENSRAILERFAHRTYAPATDASRLSGAGAGISDND
ncbi:DUF3726 domain-containing protein [Labrenzia sp. PHM005]|uniref:DUF3726 domain-containing protein n=1 Tax=Labrenzia sp. PHM005 TaxID=2590016 RepID=UPI001140800E|nr:DUF3726 domain-containing protein [Labrenzia sp. PHM005]QDG76383.1 DUF3726 domain-containing protein [Labrenzia sp. PHM005]